MVFDYRGKIPIVRDSLQTYLSLPIKSASSWPGDIQQSLSSFFIEREQLQTENAALKREVASLKALIAHQTIREAEYRRLKNLFESTATRTQPVMIAELIDSQIDANKHQIEINKGSRDAVFEGQVVIDENGVVGQVTTLSAATAGVSLITDERQSIPVFVERNRLRMLARGSGSLDDLEMEFVSKYADVRVGDKIVTSGLGNRYPRGYGIAVITEVEVSPRSEFMQIHAKPLAALDKILEVLLIQSTSEEDEEDDSTQVATNNAAGAPENAVTNSTTEGEQ